MKEKNQKNDAPPRLESRGLFGARFLDARERPRLSSRGFQRSRHKDIFLNAIGLIFLILGILSICKSIYQNEAHEIFWFCYIGSVVLGFGILKRNYFIVKSQINILAVPLIFWTIDFIYFLIAKNSLFGIVDYFFLAKRDILAQIISLEHLFSLPLSLYALFLINNKDNIKDGKIIAVSILQITVLYILSRILTAPIENINCVFKSCINFVAFTPLTYLFAWLASFILMISLTSFIIRKLLLEKLACY